jgi:hypothetical protein
MPVERKKAEKVGLRFSETMSGYLAEGVVDFEEGEKKGRDQGNSLSFDVTIEIESVSDLIKLSGQEAKLSERLFGARDALRIIPDHPWLGRFCGQLPAI